MFTRQCLQKGLVCLPLSLSACVPYITFVDDAATPPCIHTSWLGFFFFVLPLGLLRDRFNCSRIFTKQKQAVVAAVRQTGRALGKQPEFALKCFFLCFFYCTACTQDSKCVCKQRAILVEMRFLNHHNP